LLEQRPGLYRLSMGELPSGLEPGELEKIADERRQPLDVLLDRLQELRGVLLVLERAVLQRLHVSADHAERRPELVRDVRDELLAETVVPALFGHVARHEDAAGRTSLREERQGEVAAPDLRRVARGRAVAQGPPRILL